MTKEVRDAKTKLRADFINRTRVGCVNAGLITAIAQLFSEKPSLVVHPYVFAGGAFVFFITGLVLHLMAQRVLNRLGK